MKKIISMILCLMLVLSLATTAFAAEVPASGNPKITLPEGDSHAYEIYQIFTASLTEKDGKIVLSDVQWGAHGTGTGAVNQDVLKELADVATSADNEAKLDVITKYVDLDKATDITLPTAEGKKSVEVAPGYYLIKDKNAITGNDSYTTYIVEIVADATITRKADVPEVVKKIVEGESRVDENQVDIGEVFTYEFVGTLPTNIADHTTYFYKFYDTLTAGLDYVGNLTVKVNGVDVTEYFYVNATENKDADGKKTSTSLIVGIKDLLALELIDADPATDGVQSIVGDINAATTVVVTYEAKLNENAIVGTSGNKNDVYLEFDNNPNDDGEGTTTPPPENPPEEPKPETGKPTGTTPKDEVWTYTTEVIINKVDQDNQILTGAAFTISGNGMHLVVTTGEVYVAYAEGEAIVEGNCYWKLKDNTYTAEAPTTETAAEYAGETMYHKEAKVTIDGASADVNVEAFVDANGQVKFTGLGVGTYTITESVVPAGYNSIPSFTVTIGWDDLTEDDADGADGCEWTYEWSNDADNKTNETTIKNQAGSTLPETGGIGTTLFYVFGTIMVLGAAVLLITKKRMSIAE